MISSKKLASAVGGKTARACDSCIKKRARWYCAADDAFLCQACDSSVHSANLLAGRHERVRLKTASSEPSSVEPSWHNGFKRKPRTPRKSKLQGLQKNPIHLVPEIGQDENSFEENDEQEQLLYQVPILDLFAHHELCLPNEGTKRVASDKEGNLSGTVIYDCAGRKDKYSLHGFSESNNDIDEFAADVESLLGKGLDEESFDMETLGFLNCREKDFLESCNKNIETVKLEEKESTEVTMGMNIAEIDITGEKFELNFDDYESPENCEEDHRAGGNNVTRVENKEFAVGNDDSSVIKKKNIMLALDYEGVISAWADKKKPWVTGDGRPELDLNHCWPDCMVKSFFSLAFNLLLPSTLLYRTV